MYNIVNWEIQSFLQKPFCRKSIDEIVIRWLGITGCGEEKTDRRQFIQNIVLCKFSIIIEKRFFK